MKSFLLMLFTWWQGNTFGTMWHTFLNGVHVGDDQYGNRYYKSRKNNGPLGERRWVIYKHQAEATQIPPGWYGWMHHKTDQLPNDEIYTKRQWHKNHRANPTGTSEAYFPDGSQLTPQSRPKVVGDYEAWSPNE